MSVLHLNDQSFSQEIKKSKIPVLIDFWAPWCGPCQMMGPVFEKLSVEFEGKVKFVKVNTDDNPEISNTYQIQGIPTLVYLKNSKEIDRFVGFSPEDVLRQKINKLAGK